MSRKVKCIHGGRSFVRRIGWCSLSFLMVRFVHALVVASTDLSFKDQQICAGIRELVLQMTEMGGLS